MSNDWEIVQEKAFTAWVNGVLDKIHEKVSDITVDFSDGIRLIQFLELLSGKKLGKKLEQDPKSRIHKIQNVYLAINFTESLEVKPEGVAAEDIVDCNKKLILGFLWTLYRKYRIAVIKEGDKSSEEGLLLWCKNTTAGYDGVDIKNFKTGFRDGHAFLALAHKYNPEQFDYDSINKESPETRLEKAFEIAEKTINIPKLLDVHEVMKGTTDERSLILYASLFFHAFSAKAQRDALDAAQREAATRLGSLESSLNSAQHSREELLRQVSLLSEANNTKDKQIADLTEENRQLKEKNGQLEAEVKTLREQLTTLQAKFAELEERSTKQAAELETNKQSNEDLTDRLDKAEGERDTLQTQLKSTKEKLEETTKRADAEFSMLLLLRQQFDQHVLDMHRWRKLVEVDTIGDFMVEVKAPLLEELAKDGAFDAQVKVLGKKLEDETKDIQKYLHEKEEFNKQKLKK